MWGSMLFNVFIKKLEHTWYKKRESAEFKAEALRGEGEGEIVTLSITV